MSNLLSKISVIQSKVVVSKDGFNPHFKSKYVTLESIINVVDPLLRANGLVVTNHSKSGVLITSIKDIETGDSIESEFPLSASAKPQEVGSAFTYARRYNLCNLLNIVADRDDDAEGAEGRTDGPKKIEAAATPSPQLTVAASVYPRVVAETVTTITAAEAAQTAKKKVSFSKKAFTKSANTTTALSETKSVGDEEL